MVLFVVTQLEKYISMLNEVRINNTVKANQFSCW